MPYKGSNYYAQGKGKGYTICCYRCGQSGYMAKDYRVAVYNVQEDGQENHNGATEQWYGPQTTYDNHWWTNDQTQVNAVQQPQQLTLPAPSHLDATPASQIRVLCAFCRRHLQVDARSRRNKDPTAPTQKPHYPQNTQVFAPESSLTSEFTRLWVT